MIVCTRCGFQNEDSDTFCGSCAGFLEWSGEAVSEAPRPEPAAESEPTPEPEHAGFIDRVKERIGLAEKEPEGDGKDAVTAPDSGSITGDGGPGDGAAAPPGGEPAPATTAAAAVPPAGPSSATGAEPAPDTTPRMAPPAPSPPAMSPHPGDTPPAGPGSPAPRVAAAAATVPAAAGLAAAGTPTAPPPAAPPPPPTSVAPAAAAPSAPASSAAPVQPSSLPPGAPTRTGNAVAAPPAATAPGPVAPVQPAPVQPEAVKPTAVKTRPTPRAKVAPTREINPGDLVCGQCAEGNDPGRRFCRRCGASLQQAVVYSLPWYSRFWRRLTTRKARQAGDRPKTRRRAFGGAGPGWLTSWVTKVILAVIAVVLILTFVGPWHHSFRHRINRYYHNVVNVVHPTYNAVHPDGATATSFTRGHPPAFAIDGASNTSWWTGGRGTGVGQRLVIRIANPTNVDKVGFLNGDQDSNAAFLTQGRPAEVLLTFSGTHPYTKKLTLKDSQGFQTYTISAKDAIALTITIESVSPPAQPSPSGSHAAIAEVELFKKS